MKRENGTNRKPALKENKQPDLLIYLGHQKNERRKTSNCRGEKTRLLHAGKEGGKKRKNPQCSLGWGSIHAANQNAQKFGESSNTRKRIGREIYQRRGLGRGKLEAKNDIRRVVTCSPVRNGHTSKKESVDGGRNAREKNRLVKGGGGCAGGGLGFRCFPQTQGGRPI